MNLKRFYSGPRPLSALALGILVVAIPVGALPPGWWSQGNPPALSNAESNNKGVANVGQGKWMAQSALEKLRVILGAGSPVVAAIEAELYKATATSTNGVFFPERPASPSAEWLAAQRAPLQIGALKALAAPFYKHLTQLDAVWMEGQLPTNGLAVAGTDYFADTDGTLYPWNPADNQNQEKNRAAANVGQLKLVFSLRFESFDLDADGLPDGWEIEHFGDTTTAESQGIWADEVPDGDGLTNAEEAILGTDPNSSSFTGHPGSETYSYDALDRLTGVSGARVHSYGYDAAGNIQNAQ